MRYFELSRETAAQPIQMCLDRDRLRMSPWGYVFSSSRPFCESPLFEFRSSIAISLFDPTVEEQNESCKGGEKREAVKGSRVAKPFVW
jgi:hypothetical protein